MAAGGKGNSAAGREDRNGSPPLDFAAIFGALPTAYLVMTPDLVIVDANDAYLALLGRARDELVGVPVFTAFPAAPDDLDEEGRNLVQLSFEQARDTGRADHMPLQKYSVVNSATDVREVRYWSLISAPVLAADGSARYVVQRVEDVSDYVRERQGDKAAAESGLLLQRRVQEVEADLIARARELRAAVDARDLAARRLAALGDVALALTAAETLADVERIVVGRGLPVLGASGGALVTRDPAGGWQLTSSAMTDEDVRAAFAHAADESPLPAVWSAERGERLLLPTREAGLQFHPIMATVYDVTGSNGWAFFPLLVRGRCLGSLTVAWALEHGCSPAEIDSFEGLAAQCAQALERINVTLAQRRSAQENQRFFETLQRSMLTPPPEPDHLHIVVRYQPALQQAQIGGDWYDAFMQPDGSTMLVIGDVVGHDGTAAAHMGQLRGLVRALAYDPDGPPAGILSRVERAARGLAVDVLATVVLARIERVPDIPGVIRTLRWSNAGHLPLVLLAADGSSQLLEATPDLLLGVDPEAPRRDHTVALPDGSTLVMFTDGLVERRGESLDVGLARLRQVLADLGETPMNEFCDVLLQRMVADGAEDDIALIGMRAHPESEPLPKGTR